MGGDYGGRRVTVGGGIKRNIPLDFGGGLAAYGVFGECRRSGLLLWALAWGLLRWAMGHGQWIDKQNAEESSG